MDTHLWSHHYLGEGGELGGVKEMMHPLRGERYIVILVTFNIQ